MGLGGAQPGPGGPSRPPSSRAGAPLLASSPEHTPLSPACGSRARFEPASGVCVRCCGRPRLRQQTRGPAVPRGTAAALTGTLLRLVGRWAGGPEGAGPVLQWFRGLPRALEPSLPQLNVGGRCRPSNCSGEWVRGVPWSPELRQGQVAFCGWAGGLRWQAPILNGPEGRSLWDRSRSSGVARVSPPRGVRPPVPADLGPRVLPGAAGRRRGPRTAPYVCVSPYRGAFVRLLRGGERLVTPRACGSLGPSPHFLCSGWAARGRHRLPAASGVLGGSLEQPRRDQAWPCAGSALRRAEGAGSVSNSGGLARGPVYGFI